MNTHIFGVEKFDGSIRTRVSGIQIYDIEKGRRNGMRIQI